MSLPAYPYIYWFIRYIQIPVLHTGTVGSNFEFATLNRKATDAIASLLHARTRCTVDFFWVELLRNYQKFPTNRFRITENIKRTARAHLLHVIVSINTTLFPLSLFWIGPAFLCLKIVWKLCDFIKTIKIVQTFSTFHTKLCTRSQSINKLCEIKFFMLREKCTKNIDKLCSVVRNA